VGFSEIVRLVGTATVNRIVDQDLRNYRVSVDVLREALLMHGLASEALAEHIGINRNTAYVAGLLRGLGTMVLDRFAGTKLGDHQMYDQVEFETYSAWETARFGILSPQVTTMALDDWRFPDDIVAAIETHLNPPAGTGEAERLANVVNVAGAIATDHGHALPGEVMHWVLTPEKLGSLGLDSDEYDVVVLKASNLFDQQRQALY
jgi:HD-like signal output (HDOD) protein